MRALIGGLVSAGATAPLLRGEAVRTAWRHRCWIHLKVTPSAHPGVLISRRGCERHQLWSGHIQLLVLKGGGLRFLYRHVRSATTATHLQRFSPPLMNLRGDAWLSTKILLKYALEGEHCCCQRQVSGLRTDIDPLQSLETLLAHESAAFTTAFSSRALPRRDLIKVRTCLSNRQ